jgi:RNA polymerase sigma-70 factor (ECF subfamily)
MVMEDDYDAIQRCKQGDISGLESLVIRYQLPALRMVYLLTGNSSIAEDIVQDGFLRAYYSISHFKSGRSFAPWFYRILTNLVRQQQREALRQGTFSLDQLIASNVSNMHTNDELVAADPFEYVERAEKSLTLLIALNELTIKQREVIILRYYCGFNEKEMAKILHCLAGTVKWRLHAGLKALERIIRKKYSWLLSTDCLDISTNMAESVVFTAKEDSSHV